MAALFGRQWCWCMPATMHMGGPLLSALIATESTVVAPQLTGRLQSQMAAVQPPPSHTVATVGHYGRPSRQLVTASAILRPADNHRAQPTCNECMCVRGEARLCCNHNLLRANLSSSGQQTIKCAHCTMVLFSSTPLRLGLPALLYLNVHPTRDGLRHLWRGNNPLWLILDVHGVGVLVPGCQ